MTDKPRDKDAEAFIESLTSATTNVILLASMTAAIRAMTERRMLATPVRMEAVANAAQSIGQVYIQELVERLRDDPALLKDPKLFMSAAAETGKRLGLAAVDVAFGGGDGAN